MRATIITDASFCPQTKAHGWACWISLDGGKKVRRSGSFLKNPVTSNEAELWAAVNGLVIAYAEGARTILLQTDCLGVVQSMGKEEVFQANWAHRFPGASISLRHVKGHTDNPDARSWVNRWCDRQARVHMRAMRSTLRKGVFTKEDQE